MNHDPARRIVLRKAGLGLTATAFACRQAFARASLRGAAFRCAPDRTVWLKHRWHLFPDGGATYPTSDRGWIYVSNSECPGFLDGGAGASGVSAETLADGS